MPVSLYSICAMRHHLIISLFGKTNFFCRQILQVDLTRHLFLLERNDCAEELDVHSDDVLTWCDNNGIDRNCYFETSARTGAYVNEAFDCVIDIAMKHSFRQNV